ncbi:MAG: hypothetical protein E7587_01160 [Ruminococcaceae bacterium]|nr:hypothetical protein [Oscillospiraceae bacterium]
MLDKIRKFLKCFIFVELGSLFGKALADYIHYRRYPEFYEMMSAPWYTDILLSAVLTAAVVFLTFLAYIILGCVSKKQKKAKEKTEAES